MPSRRTLAALTTATLALLVCPHASAQQQPQPPKQQAQLEQRLAELEKRLAAAEQKAAQAEIQKAYTDQIQKDVKDYYEKALDQVKWTAGLLLAAIGVLSSLATFYSVKWFDDRTKQAIATARSELRQEFTTQMQAELETLRKESTARLKTLEEGLTQQIEKETTKLRVRSNLTIALATGVALGKAGGHNDARQLFRWALKTCASNREASTPETAQILIKQLFLAIKVANPQKFEEEAKKELAADFFKDFTNELNAAAIEIPELADVLRKK